MTAVGFRRNLFLASPIMRGEDVLALQNALVRHGAAIARDGLFGLATQAAVRAFQLRMSLVQDGIAGPTTWATLFDQDDGALSEPGAARLQADDGARHCFDKLHGEHGFTAEQACGIVANIARESRFNPAAVGDGLRAYGLGQWHPDRQDAFRTRFGRSIVGSSVDDQLAFIHFEMTAGREQRAYQKLQAARTAREAGEVVSRFYERPGAADAEAQLRGASADAYFQRFTASAGASVPRPVRPVALPFRVASDILGGEQIQELMRPHRLFRDSVEWALSDDGIETAGVPAATVGNADRDLVLQVLEEQQGTLIPLLGNGQIPVELALAALCVARPLAGAVTIGPGGDLRDAGRTPDCVSAGLMQATLGMARTALNRPGLTVDNLRQPDTAIQAGLGVLWLQAAETRFDPPLVAAMYAVGALRPHARSRWKLLEYETITTDYVDRFVRFFNAAMQAVKPASLPPQVSSFQRLLDTPVVPVASAGHGPYVARNPKAWIGAAPVTTGQCVALVQKAADAPLTKFWRQGGRVRDDASIQPGTAIATFDDDGSYGNHTDGRSHAALYTSQDAGGLWVVDQWKGQPPHERHIRFHNDGAPKVNRGEFFFIIG